MDGSLGGKMVGCHMNGVVRVGSGMVVEMRRNMAESCVDRDADHESGASFDPDVVHAFALVDDLAYLSPALWRCFAETACYPPPASLPFLLLLPLPKPSLSMSRKHIRTRRYEYNSLVRGRDCDRGRTRLLGRKKKSRPIL